MESSLFFVTLPKSGTTFTWHTIAKCSSLTIPSTAQDQASLDQIFNGSEQDLDWEVSTGSFYTERLVENDVWETRAKGMVCGSHMRATPNNLAVLKNKGIKKLTLLLRDPRDATLSWAHHINLIGNNALLNDHVRKFTPFPDDYWHWSFEDQLSYHCKTYLPLCINWIECWLNFIAIETEIDFNIVYFDQLRSDPVNYFKQIAEFHDLKNFDYSQIKKPSIGEAHFRKGVNGGFYSEAKSEDIALAELLISTRLKDAFDRAVKGQFNNLNEDNETKRKLFITNFPNIPLMAKSLKLQMIDKVSDDLFAFNSSWVDQTILGETLDVDSTIRTTDNQLLNKIESIKTIEDNLRIVVWGAGDIFTKLHRYSLLAQKNLIAILDKKQHQKSTLCGIPLYHPDALTSLKPDLVIIASIAFHDEIRQSVYEIDPQLIVV